MNQDVTNQLYAILQVIVPAIAGLVIGHYHVILKNPAAPTPPPPPVVPPVDPNNLPIGQGGILQQLAKLGSSLPKVDPTKPIAPVGQGGILQLTTLLLQGILSSPATPSAKAAAINQVVAATQSLETPEKP